MDAGHDLDVLVGTHVMGWEWAEPDGYWRTGAEHMPYGWSPSQDIHAAFDVVAAMHARDFLVNLASDTGGDWWVCDFENETHEYEGEADAAPLAICLAALKSVEVYTQQVPS